MAPSQWPRVGGVLLVLVVTSLIIDSLAELSPIRVNDESEFTQRDISPRREASASSSGVSGGCDILAPPSTIVPCGTSTTPDTLGFATPSEAGASFTITYTDVIEEQSCKGPGSIIRLVRRQWGCDGVPSPDGLQMIGIRDSAQPPTIAPLEPVAIPCNNTSNPSIDPSVTGYPTVTLNCTVVSFQVSDSPALVTCNPDTCEPYKTIARTFLAVDQCGNAAPPVTQLLHRQMCDASAANLCQQCRTPAAPPPSMNRLVPMGNIGSGFNCFTGESTKKLVFALQKFTATEQRVFEYTANATKITYLVPDQAHVIVAPSCGIQSYSFSRLSDYVQMEAQSMGISVGVSMYGASLTLNPEVASTAQRMRSDDSHFLLAQEYADLYSVLLEPYSMPFDSAFTSRVKELPDTFNQTTNDAFVSFLNDYGTHVSIEVTLGGRLRYKSFVSNAEAAEMSSTNTKMHVSLGFLSKKFPFSGADGWEGASKRTSEAKPFATSGGLTIEGGDIAISVKQARWFEQWVASVHRAPVVTRRRVEPILSYLTQIGGPAIARAFSDFLVAYSANAPKLPSVPLLPIFFSWADAPVNCSRSSKQLSCPTDVPLTLASTYYDSSYKAHYIVTSKLGEGRRPCIKWVSKAANRVFRSQPYRVLAPRSSSTTPPFGANSYFRHGRIGVSSAAPALSIPGLDQLGTGFDALTGTHRLPVLNWTYSFGNKWHDGIIDADYAIPDQVVFREYASSKPVRSGIYYSSSEYENGLAEHSGISLRVPGLFSLDYTSEFSAQVFSGGESILGVASREYLHYSLELRDVAGAPLAQAFVAHVASLPSAYDQEQYFSFLRYYGTHMVTDAFYGGSARLLTALNQQLYSTRSSVELARGLSAQFGMFEAGLEYGTDNLASSIEFSSNSFSWLALGGGIGSEVLTNQWSSWIRSTKIRPIQLSRTAISLDLVVARLDAAKAANLKSAISTFISLNRSLQPRYAVPPGLKVQASPTTSKLRGFYTGAKSVCYWHYVFDSGYTPRKDAETWTEFSWNAPKLGWTSPGKFLCRTIAATGALVSCPLDSWATSTSTASGGHQCPDLAAAPINCCKLAYYP